MARYLFVPKRDSNNFFNIGITSIGITCRNFPAAFDAGGDVMDASICRFGPTGLFADAGRPSTSAAP